MCHSNALINAILICAALNFNVIAQFSPASTNNPCARIYRTTRRTGFFVSGQIQIPEDSNFPKFKIDIQLNKPIHSLSIRQLKAKDVGSHREFTVDSMAPLQNGLITLNTVMRMRTFFGAMPRVSRVSYNGKILCGDGAGESSVGGGSVNNDTVVVTPHGAQNDSVDDIFKFEISDLEDDEADEF